MFNPFSYISKMAEIRSLSQEMAVISNRVNQRIKIIVVRLFLNSCCSNRFKTRTILNNRENLLSPESMLQVTVNIIQRR